jgi:hypothetical protein
MENKSHIALRKGVSHFGIKVLLFPVTTEELVHDGSHLNPNLIGIEKQKGMYRSANIRMIEEKSLMKS